jgi:hypothetical protein
MLNPLIKVARCFHKIRYRFIAPFLGILASVCGFLRLRSWERSLCAKSAEIIKEHNEELANTKEHINEELAKILVGPMRRALDYQGVGRRLMTIDELPQGASVTYSAPATYPSYPNTHITDVNFVNRPSDAIGLVNAAYGYVNTEYRGDMSYVMTTGARTNVATETISTSTSPFIAFESGTAGVEIINENNVNSFAARNIPVIDTSHGPYGLSFYYAHISSKDYGEKALNDYLVWYANEKVVREIEKRRKNVKSIIEIGD